MTVFDPSKAWPSGSMGLLIEAAYHSDRLFAEKQWRNWLKDHGDFDDLKWQSIRMLVQVAAALEKQMSDETRSDISAAVQPFAWTGFENHLQNVGPLLNSLSSAGIPIMMLKGAAAVLTGIVAPQTRLMADLDILINPSRIDSFMDVAETLGWRSKWPLSRPGFRECLVSSRHSVPLTNGERWELDLHTSAFLLNRCPDHDMPLWERAVPARTNDVDVLVPGVTDMLVITLGHGLLANRHPMGIWVGDAIALIESGSVDWDLLIEEVARRDLYPFSYVSLSYLQQRLARPIPGWVLDNLLTGVREPFISELLGHIEAPHATSRDYRISWGAAATVRAQKWQARIATGSAGYSAGSRHAAAWTPWQAAKHTNGSRYAVPVSEEVRHPASPLVLEARLCCGTDQSPERVSVALICFDYHVCELAQAGPRDDTTEGEDPPLEGPFRFNIEPAVLNAYSLRRLQLELLIPGSLQASPITPAAVEYRWRI